MKIYLRPNKKTKNKKTRNKYKLFRRQTFHIPTNRCQMFCRSITFKRFDLWCVSSCVRVCSHPLVCIFPPSIYQTNNNKQFVSKTDQSVRFIEPNMQKYTYIYIRRQRSERINWIYKRKIRIKLNIGVSRLNSDECVDWKTLKKYRLRIYSISGSKSVREAIEYMCRSNGKCEWYSERRLSLMKC